jgi:hypothetical protein
MWHKHARVCTCDINMHVCAHVTKYACVSFWVIACMYEYFLLHNKHAHAHTHTHTQTITHTWMYRACIYINTCIQTCIYTHMNAQVMYLLHKTYIRTHIHTHTNGWSGNTKLHIHTYMHTYTHTHVHKGWSSNTKLHIHTYMHMYMHTHTHTYVQKVEAAIQNFSAGILVAAIGDELFPLLSMPGMYVCMCVCM